MKNKLPLLALLLSALTLGGCGDTTSSSESENSFFSESISSSSIDDTSSEYIDPIEDPDNDRPEKEVHPLETLYSDYDPSTSSYIGEAEVKTNLMWDVNAISNITPEITTLSNYSLGERITAITFKGAKFSSKASTDVFACIGVPDAAKYPCPEQGYPALVLVHGGAGYVFTDWINYWTDKGFVAIALDMFGNMLDENGNKAQNPNGGPIERDGPNYDDPNSPYDSWVYHSVYNIMMCNNILRDRADVNNNQIGAVGISWGSVALSIVSGVDLRFAAFTIVYGAGDIETDSMWNTRGGTFMDSSKLDAWKEKYDPTSYLPYSIKPTLFVSGVNDNCFSFVNRMNSYKLTKGKAFYSQRSDLSHGNSWNQTYEIYAFFLHTLLNQDTLSMINPVTRVEGKKIYFSYENQKFDTAQLVYTTSTDSDSHKWAFSVQLISIANGWVTMPDGITAYTIEFIHNDISSNYHLSTKLEII